MPGIEDVLVQWAPTVAPLATPGDPTDWVTLEDHQSIKTKTGRTVDGLTKQFTIGTADIRVRNGDTTGRPPVFLPTESYKGRNIRVRENAVVGQVFLGRIDRVEYHYDDSPFAGYVTLHCLDAVGSASDVAVVEEMFGDTLDYFVGVAQTEPAIQAILNEVFGGSVSASGEFSHQYVKAPDKFDDRQGMLDFLNQVLLTEGATVTADPATNEVHVRGRWQPLRLLAADAPDPVVFTDTAPDGTTTFEYRRDDLEWADGDEDFINSVQALSKYLKTTVLLDNEAASTQRIAMSRTELVTIRQGWVEANARMWMTLYNQSRSYPKKIKFMVGTRGRWSPSIFAADLAPNLDFERQFQVLHTPPGSTQITYRLAVDYIEHDIDRQRWLCTLGFTSLDRFWFGYGNGTDPIELIQIDGDSDHGIDSLAIIAP